MIKIFFFHFEIDRHTNAINGEVKLSVNSERKKLITPQVSILQLNFNINLIAEMIVSSL